MSTSEKHNKQKKEKGVVLKTLKYFFPVAWKFSKGYFVISVINLIFQTVLPFVDIFIMPLLIDALCQREKNIPLIITYAALMVGLDVVIGLIGSLLTIHLEKYEDKFLNYQAEQIADRCMNIDFALTENKECLDQINKAREGKDWSGGIHQIAKAFFLIIQNALKIVGVVAVLVISAPWLLLIIGVLLVVSALINAKKNGIEVKYFSDLSNINRILHYIMFEVEDFRFGKDVRLYGAAGTLIERAQHQMDRLNKFYKKRADKRYPLDVADVIVSVLRDFGTYMYLGALAIMRVISIGVYSQLTTAGGTLSASLQGVVFGAQDIVKRCNYGYEMVKLMEYPEMLCKGSKRVENLSSAHEIEFRNVSFSYPKTGVQVLKNVSITLKAGEKLSVVGLNGAGKTTFIKLLCRLYDVDEGEILLDGVNIRDYDYEEYMKLFSVVFQDFRLLSFTAKENILLGKDDSNERVDEMFGKVGLLDKVNSLPHGRDTMMFRNFDKDGVQLSGGEQQKMAIARALYKDAPVVILDEPTAALDPVAEYEIYRRFDELVSGKSAVYISHRLSSCRFCDRIAVFSEGTIKELGTHEQLVNKENGVYAEMFHAQAQYYV